MLTKKGKRAVLCYSFFVVLLANFENCLLEVLHCICGKGNGMGAVSCTFKALTINVTSLLIYIGDKITELKGLSWVIRRMVPCNSAVSDEKHLQIFSLFHSFHLKWKFITSSMWCFMLCPSICCGKEVGWQFSLCVLNWSHAMKKLCLMVTTGFTLAFFLPIFSMLLLNSFWCYVGVVTWVTKTCIRHWNGNKKMVFCPKGYQECIVIMCTIFLSSISAILQRSKLLVGCIFKTFAFLDVSWEVLQLKMSWKKKILLYPQVNISQLVR